MEDFDISETTGFLLETPLEVLPEYFEPWNDLSKKMPSLVKNKTFRERVQKIPLLDHTLLSGVKEKRLANLQLTVIAAGYMWQDGQENVPKVLPACVSVPLWEVSKELGIQPVVSHPGLYLANWKFKDPTKTLSLENIQCLYGFPGGEEAEAFINIINITEIDFLPGLKCIVKGTKAVDSNDVDELVNSLHGIQDSIKAMINTFAQMHNLVSAETFYDEFKPFLEGWGSSALPEGLVYEGISDTPAKFSGDTGAQTSIIASIDAFLGIKHKGESQDFLLRMRDYMPPGHRRFIEVLETRPSTNAFVKNSACDRLTSAYNNCISALKEFRSYHINIVAKYIILMSKRGKVKSNEDNNDESAGLGTGGTSVMPFLKGLRADTEGNRVSA